MTRVTLRVLGVPVLCLTVERGFVYVDDGDVDGEPLFGGGSAHNFERDVNPVTPEDRYMWEEWDGFGFRSR